MIVLRIWSLDSTFELRGEFSAKIIRTSQKRGFSIAEGFQLLHFPLDESNVCPNVSSLFLYRSRAIVSPFAHNSCIFFSIRIKFVIKYWKMNNNPFKEDAKNVFKVTRFREKKKSWLIILSSPSVVTSLWTFSITRKMVDLWTKISSRRPFLGGWRCFFLCRLARLFFYCNPIFPKWLFRL